ncbi:MAG: hypothetical protein AMJ93_08425 [Anaerolineae bacterium SM23_84]|nr:MAG: hypothetical protein AMJ93_08425 [Anaerolineae bacterium SM23_84]
MEQLAPEDAYDWVPVLMRKNQGPLAALRDCDRTGPLPPSVSWTVGSRRRYGTLPRHSATLDSPSPSSAVSAPDPQTPHVQARLANEV